MSIFSSAQNLFDFSNFQNNVDVLGTTKSLLLGAGAGAALGVSLELAYQVGKGKGGVISGLIAAGTASLSTVPLSYLGFTRGQQILFSAGVPLLGDLLIGLLNRKSPDKLVATLSPYVDWASEAGKQVLTIAATASLTLFGVNALATNKPGSWSGSPHLSEVNAALKLRPPDLNAQTWNNDPTTTVAVQRDGQFTRVVLINPLAVNLTAVSAGAAVVKTGTSDGSTPAAGSASNTDPYVGVEVITFANGQVPSRT